MGSIGLHHGLFNISMALLSSLLNEIRHPGLSCASFYEQAKRLLVGLISTLALGVHGSSATLLQWRVLIRQLS